MPEAKKITHSHTNAERIARIGLPASGTPHAGTGAARDDRTESTLTNTDVRVRERQPSRHFHFSERTSPQDTLLDHDY